MHFVVVCIVEYKVSPEGYAFHWKDYRASNCRHEQKHQIRWLDVSVPVSMLSPIEKLCHLLIDGKYPRVHFISCRFNVSSVVLRVELHSFQQSKSSKKFELRCAQLPRAVAHFYEEITEYRSTSYVPVIIVFSDGSYHSTIRYQSGRDIVKVDMSRRKVFPTIDGNETTYDFSHLPNQQWQELRDILLNGFDGMISLSHSVRRRIA